jgi:hypothetical protein
MDLDAFLLSTNAAEASMSPATTHHLDSRLTILTLARHPSDRNYGIILGIIMPLTDVRGLPGGQGGGGASGGARAVLRRLVRAVPN